MMTVSKISSAGGAADYFTKDGFGDVLGSDKEPLAGEYYTSGTDTGAAQWHGKLASELGLDKVESKEQFNDMLSGKLPSGEQLPAGPTGERTAGWDATFSAPKSVSIQALVAGDERVIKAHDEAVKEALNKLEERTSTRVKEDGKVSRVDTGKLAIATFRHDTNRNLDPQLHTHAAIMNVTKTEDGKYRSIESKDIYRAQKEIGEDYRRSLADKLEKAGYQLEKTHDEKGFNFEIKGVPEQIRKDMSSRSGEVEKALEERGLTRETASAKEKELATLDTRKPKETPANRQELQKEWQQQTAEQGFDPKALAEEAKARAAEPGHAEKVEAAKQADAITETKRSIEKLSETRAVIVEREIIQDVKERTSLTDDQIKSALDKHEKTGAIESRQTHDKYTDKAAKAYTTKSQVDVEKQLIASTQRLTNPNSERNKNAAIMSEKKADAVVEKASKDAEKAGFKMTEEQKSALKGVLSDKQQMHVVQGLAGTAKTTSVLKNATAAMQKAGHTVTAAAPTVSASTKLQSETQADKSKTLQGLIAERGMESLLRKDGGRDFHKTMTKAQKSAQSKADRYEKAASRLEKMASDKTVLGINATTSAGSQEIKDAMRDPLEKRDNSALAAIERGRTEGYAMRTSSGEILTRNDFSGKIDGKWGASWDKASLADRAVGAALGEGVAKDLQAKAAEYRAKAEEYKKEAQQIADAKAGKSKEVIVLDEAGMADAKQTAALQAYAERTGTRIIATGDDKQHGSVGAGEAFSQTKEATKAAGGKVHELTDIKRQQNEQLKSAVNASVQGKISEALNKIEKGGGSVREIADRGERREQIAKDYAALTDAQRDKTIVVDPSKESGKKLTESIRDKLKESGELKREKSYETYESKGLESSEYKYADRYEAGDVLRDTKSGEAIGTVKSVDLTKNTVTFDTKNGEKTLNARDINSRRSELVTKQETNFAVGDRVRANTATSLGDKGSSGRVVGHSKDGLKVQDEAGKTHTISHDQVKDMTHNYVTTSHKSQGQTVDRAMINMDSKQTNLANRQTAYVAVSRAKFEAHIYTDQKEALAQTVEKNTGVTQTAVDVKEAVQQDKQQDKQQDQTAKMTRNDSVTSRDNAVKEQKTEMQKTQDSSYQRSETDKSADRSESSYKRSETDMSAERSEKSAQQEQKQEQQEIEQSGGFDRQDDRANDKDDDRSSDRR